MSSAQLSNARVKRAYCKYLAEADGLDSVTIENAKASLDDFERLIRGRDFGSFTFEDALGYKKQLETRVSAKTNQPLSLGSIRNRLVAIAKFYRWLAERPGYKSKIDRTHIAYLKLNRKELRIVDAVRSRPIPTLEQARHVVLNMPSRTELERRDRAVVALFILCAPRIAALTSLRLKHVDLVGRRIIQDGAEVKTKFGKSFSTYFFPVGEDVERIFVEWVEHLRNIRLWGEEDPIFPVSHSQLSQDGLYENAGFAKRPWATSQSARNIFKDAFKAAGMTPFHPHSIRSTLVTLGERFCDNAEDFKAWSQNLGHEKVMTTFTSYGTVAPHRQATLFAAMRERKASDVSKLSPADVKRLKKMLDLLDREEEEEEEE